MEIRSVVHKGLRRFLEANDSSALHPQAAGKIRKIVTFLMQMRQAGELQTMPHWRMHRLIGGEKKQMESDDNAQLARDFQD